MKINTSIIKKIAVVEPNLVMCFAKTCAKLYGQLAIRENFVQNDGHGRTIEEVTLFADPHFLESQKVHIASLAEKCRALLATVDRHAKRHGFGAAQIGLEEATRSSFVDAVAIYVEGLFAESDYEMWLNEIRTNR